MHATRLWALWQAILLSLAGGFTQQGKKRFIEWVTGLALNVEEHTITQSLIAPGRCPSGATSWRRHGRVDAGRDSGSAARRSFTVSSAR
jgi:hypothetical protein